MRLPVLLVFLIWGAGLCSLSAQADKSSPEAELVGRREVLSLRDTYRKWIETKLPVKSVLWDVALHDRESETLEKIRQITILDDALYVETENHHLYAIAQADGITRWVFRVGAHLDFRPCMVEGIVAERNSQRELANNLFKLLEEERRKKLPDRAVVDRLSADLRDAQKRYAAVQGEDRIYFVAKDTLYCLGRESGNLMWKTLLTFNPSTPPAASRTHVFVGSQDRDRVIAVSTRILRESGWYRAHANITSQPIYHEPILYFASEDQGIYAYGVDDGSQRWHNQVAEKGFSCDLALYIDRSQERNPSYLFAGSRDYSLYVVDPVTGRLRWKFETGAPITTPAVVDWPVVYVKSDKNALFALDAPTGKLLWKLPRADRFLIRGNRAVYLLRGSRIFAVSPKTGEIMNRFPRGPFAHLVTNTASPVLYMATRDGFLFAAQESLVR